MSSSTLPAPRIDPGPSDDLDVADDARFVALAENRDALLDTAAAAAKDFLAGVASRPVAADTSPSHTRTLQGALGGALTEDGTDPRDVLATFVDTLPDGATASAGPRFFGYVTGGTLPIAVALDWMVSAIDQFAATYDAGPAVAVAEEAAIGWIADLLGLDGPGRTVSGGFVTGTTEAHIAALATARSVLLARRGDTEAVERTGLWGVSPLPVLVGGEVHVSILMALKTLGMGTECARRVPTDEHGRMRIDALREALAACDGPALVCAQAGEINTGSFDDLAAVAELVRDAEAGHWLHVDGAFGLWAAASPRLAHLTRGLELADSWATDFHKIPNGPYDGGVVLSRHGEAMRSALSSHAGYTRVGPSVVEWQQRHGMDYTLGMARRARGVPAWGVLRTLGRRGVAELVDRCHDNAVRLAEHLAAVPGVTVPHEVTFNQVLIDAADPDLDADAAEVFVRAVVATVRASGTCWLGGTTFGPDHRPMLRASVANWSTTAADIDASAAAIADAITRVRTGGAHPGVLRENETIADPMPIPHLG